MATKYPINQNFSTSANIITTTVSGTSSSHGLIVPPSVGPAQALPAPAPKLPIKHTVNIFKHVFKVEITNTADIFSNYYHLKINGSIKFSILRASVLNLENIIDILNNNKTNKLRKTESDIKRILSMYYIFKYYTKNKVFKRFYDIYINTKISTLSISDRNCQNHYYIYLGTLAGNRIYHVINMGRGKYNTNKINYDVAMKHKIKSYNEMTVLVKDASTFALRMITKLKK